MLDLVNEQLDDGDTVAAREEAYFAGARIDDDELRDPPPRTSSAGHKRGPDTPTRRGAPSGSDTTSAPR